MREPQYAELLIKDKKRFLIVKIHYDSRQVPLKETEKVYNTVRIADVDFDFADFTEKEKEEFCRKFV